MMVFTKENIPFFLHDTRNDGKHCNVYLSFIVPNTCNSFISGNSVSGDKRYVPYEKITMVIFDAKTKNDTQQKLSIEIIISKKES